MSLNPGDAALGAFQFDVLEQAAGTFSPESVCWSESRIFFYTRSGFYSFTGGQMVPIGANRIDKWFLQNVKREGISRMKGVVDRRNRLVLWGFESQRSEAHQIDSLLIYNWTSNRWSYARLEPNEAGTLVSELLTEYIPTTKTLDDLADLYPSIDASGIPSFDSDTYLGGAISLSVFDTDHKLAVFAGDPLPAVFETGEFGSSRERLFCSGIRPVIDQTDTSATTIRACVHFRDKPTSVQCVPTTPTPVNESGECPQRVNARYQRYRVYVDEGFNHAHGVVPRVKLLGTR